MKTELRQKVILQVSVRELHVGMLKEYATRFSMEYGLKLLVNISDYDLQSIIPPQLKKMIHIHKILCG